MRESVQESEHDKYKYNHFIFITMLVLWGVFTISPLISYYFSLVVLAFSPQIKAITRKSLGLLIVLSGTVYIASRDYNSATGDDITYVYYPAYRAIFYGSDYFTAFGGGFEFVLSSLLKLLAISFDKPVDKDIFTTIFVFLPYLIYYIWLEKFGLEYVHKDKKNLCTSASLGIMGLLTLSIQLRQGLATPILLLAISYYSRSKIKSIFFTALSICTHLTSIPILFIINMFKGDSTKNKTIALIFIIVLVLAFQFIAGAIVSGNLLGSASFKFQYYTGDDQLEGVRILSFFFALVIMMIAGIFFFDTNKELRKWKSLIIWGGAAYFVLLPIPLASDRLFMIMSVFMMGYLLFLSFSRVSNLFRLLLVAYFIYKFLMNGPLMTVFGGFGDYTLWTNYDWIGDYPLYFWIK